MEVVETVTSLLLWLGKPRHIMTFLFTVEIGNMTQVPASRVGNVGGIDSGVRGRTRVVSSLLVFIVSLCQQFK